MVPSTVPALVPFFVPVPKSSRGPFAQTGFAAGSVRTSVWIPTLHPIFQSPSKMASNTKGLSRPFKKA